MPILIYNQVWVVIIFNIDHNMTGLITLTTAGIMTGPFNIYSNVDGYLSAFAYNISRDQLLSGYPTDNIPEGTSNIKIVSSGACYNSIILNIPPATTTTTSSTSTTTSSTTLPVGTLYGFRRDGSQEEGDPSFHIPYVEYIDPSGNPAQFYADMTTDICGYFYALSIVANHYCIMC